MTDKYLMDKQARIPPGEDERLELSHLKRDGYCEHSGARIDGPKIEVELTGITPLLQHRMTEEQLFGLLGAKSEKKKIKEVLTPRQIAENCSYKAKDGSYYIPTDYICGAFANVASDYKQKSSSKKSLKGVARGIFRPTTETATLLCPKNKPIKDFEVDVRRATNHLKGAIAVCRPRFDCWKVRLQIHVDDSIVETEVCNQILCDAGKRAGIGSFRVQRGGYFGQFIVTRWKELE